MTKLTATELQNLLDGPALAAPSGAHHDFVNPPGMKVQAYVAVFICLSVSILVIGMRMWTKIRLIRQVMLEDCI